MTKVAIVRCEKNESRCPLTNCLTCLMESRQGLAGYDQVAPIGVFTCRCPGDNIADLAGILKSKGAEAIHFCTCMFAKKIDAGWDAANGGFCDHLDALMDRAQQAAGIPCVKGTAHLPKGYTPESRL